MAFPCDGGIAVVFVWSVGSIDWVMCCYHVEGYDGSLTCVVNFIDRR